LACSLIAFLVKAARRMLAGLNILLLFCFIFLTIRQTLDEPHINNPAKVYQRFGSKLNLINTRI